MLELVLFAGTFVLATVATLLFMRVRRRRRGRTSLAPQDRARRDRLNERLADRHDVTRTHLERPPRLVQLVRLRGSEHGQSESRGDEDEPDDELIPVVRFDLGMTEVPSTDLVFEYVASALEAIHPELADEPVVHYDVQFRFGPDGLFVSRTCVRVAVPTSLAERLVTEERYRAHDLQRDVARGDDGHEETPPVQWGECRTY